MTTPLRTPALLLALVATRVAAAPPPQTSAQVITAAEREGLVVLYTTTDPASAKPLLDDFAALYPKVRVEMQHLYSSQLYDRFLAEESARAETADVLWSSGMDLQMKLANDGYALDYRSPESEHLPSWAMWKGEAYGTTFEPIVFAYDTSRLAAAEVPRTHRDLARLLHANAERFQGRVATYDPERSGIGCLLLTNDARADPSFESTIRAYGEARPKLFVSSIHVLDGIRSGEHLLGFNVIASYALARRREHPSLGIVYPRDYTLVLSRIALITKAARHPNAARLFLDYLLSARGQEIAANVSGLGSIRDDVAGEVTAASLTKELGASLRPIAVGPSLLVYLDQANRNAFLKRWQRVIDGK
jgi:iron(III) transport system substrate-binding protein